jgi:hypothetical protein
MRSFFWNRPNNFKLFVSLAKFGSLIGLVFVLVSCGGSSSTMSPTQMGTITLTLTDPPRCKFPNGDFEHVFVTIRSVQAHTSSSANDDTAGWQELAPQLIAQPMQIDLFAPGVNACLLTTLGSKTALPAGNYQQIRVLLVPNDGSGGATPAPNACAGHGFNCVALHDGSIHELELSSQAKTGLKIPPGQVVGGPIVVNPGQDVDLNIDFNACDSILRQGNGKFRLKPVLTAGQVSTNSTGISGKIVDAGTNAPIVGGTVLVALEQPDSTGVDVIFQQVAVDSSGNFNFCPLPTGATFDLVATAINGAGIAYNATVAIGVPGGTNVGSIPLIPETGVSTATATIQGTVTAANGAMPGTIDAAVTALQSVALGGGNSRLVAIPSEGNSITNISVQTNTSCPTGAPANTNCEQYSLQVPASNPHAGVFSSGSVVYAPPAAGDVLYSIRVKAFVPMGGGTPSCSPSSQTTNQDNNSNSLRVTGGNITFAKELDFTGCS